MSSEESGRRRFLRLGALAGMAGSAAAIGAASLDSASAEAPSTSNSVASGGDFNIRQYGALGNGNDLDTSAIQAAVNAAALHGGGTVLFPPGAYLCHSVQLKSRVALHFQTGATLIAAHPTPSHSYDPVEPQDPKIESYQDFGHNHWHNSLLWGENLHEIAVTGQGTIRGDGLIRDDDAAPPGSGNKVLALKNCRGVLLRDFTVRKAGHFALLATGVDNLTVSNLLLDVERDGMDIDCCRNVRISDCTVNSPFDDAIVLKASYALGAPRACEQVTITGCFVTGRYEVGSLADGRFAPFQAPPGTVPTGRIKLGTESTGPFRNIAIANCIFEGCRGLALESVDGSTIEDVAISNITMREMTGPPLFVRLGDRLRAPRGTPVGALRRISISNLVCSGAPGAISSILTGIPNHPIEELTLAEISITYAGAAGVKAPETLPELGDKYPEPEMFGPTPSSGIFARHIRSLTLSNVGFAEQAASAAEAAASDLAAYGAPTGDARPAVVLEDVDRAFLFHLNTPERPAGPALSLRRVRRLRTLGCTNIPDAQIEDADVKKL